jgi:diguanylate cyclase (GGDEF)-like protein
VPIDPRALEPASTGSQDPDLVRALEAAEREAFKVGGDGAAEVGAALLSAGESHPGPHACSSVSVDGAHAIAAPMRARVGSGRSLQYFGVIAIARRGEPFDEQERELLEYLAAQAVISIENVDLHETIQRQAITDELTGLANLRMFHAAIDREIERSRRFDTPLGLVMLDLDDFKPINDEYGHQQGDTVLVQVARVVRDLSRDIDEPVRYGGEELAVVLPQTDVDGAMLAAERMREAIEELEVQRLDGRGKLRVTASFGVAALPDSADDGTALVAAADQALYRAKRAGKNCVERAQPAAAAR